MNPNPLLRRFLAGEGVKICLSPDGQWLDHIEAPELVFPGSFHPLHRGHRELAIVAERRLGKPVHFEISVRNVDKPSIHAEVIERRVQQFADFRPVWLCRAPLFAEKAELFPGATFVVGADTAQRIVDLRYYKSPLHLQQSFAELRKRGCRFLVGGRLDSSGNFIARETLPIPSSVADLFEGVSEADFRVDISSTELRAGS